MQLTRTTITLPDDLLQAMKMRAVQERTTISGLIRKIAEKEIKLQKKKKKLHIQFGKYSLGTTDTFRREEMYDEYLKEKMSPR